MPRTGLRSADRKKTTRIATTKESPLKAKKHAVVKFKVTITKKDKDKVKGLSYLDEIKHAILHDKLNRYTSALAITSYIKKNYPARAQKHQIRRALQAGVDSKKLVKIRASYRLSKAELVKEDKKKKVAKKTTKKTTTKTAPRKVSKKATTAKKASATKKTVKKATPASKKTTTTKTTAKTAPKKTPLKVPVEAKEKAPQVAKPKKVSQLEGPHWQYLHKGWHPYDDSASIILEGVYQEWQASRESGIDIRPVHSGSFDYMVDFAKNTQRNTETGTVRPIRRVVN